MKNFLYYCKHVVPWYIAFGLLAWCAFTGAPIKWIMEWAGESLVKHVIAVAIAITFLIFVIVLLIKSDMEKDEKEIKKNPEVK